MTSESAPRSNNTRSNGLCVRRTLADSLYAVTAFPVSLVAFVLALPLMATGFASAVLALGLFVLLAAVLVARVFSAFERTRLQTMLGEVAASPYYQSPSRTSGWWRRMLDPLRDPQSWRDVTWALLSLLTGTVAFTVVVTWWAVALSGLTYWAWQGFLDDGSGTITVSSALGLGEGRVAESLIDLVIGACPGLASRCVPADRTSMCVALSVGLHKKPGLTSQRGVSVP